MDLRRPLSIITPTLDGDVLAVLAGADAAFSGRQVHRLLGHSSEEGVRKALSRLVRQGIVVVYSAGAARMYELNRDHLAAPYIEALSALSRELVARMRDTVNAWPIPPAYLGIFGSAARGEADVTSDIDLLVVRPARVGADDPQWLRQTTDLSSTVMRWTGNDARILEYGERELPKGGMNDSGLGDVRRDGIPIYGTLPVAKRRRPA